MKYTNNIWYVNNSKDLIPYGIVFKDPLFKLNFKTDRP